MLQIASVFYADQPRSIYCVRDPPVNAETDSLQAMKAGLTAVGGGWARSWTGHLGNGRGPCDPERRNRNASPGPRPWGASLIDTAEMYGEGSAESSWEKPWKGG